jgi:hypothetical protein
VKLNYHAEESVGIGSKQEFARITGKAVAHQRFSDKIDDVRTGVMRTPVGLGYYNPYYFLRPFTRQKLVSEATWDTLFARAGFRLVAKKKLDPAVDPTGLEIGWVLEFAPDSRKADLRKATHRMPFKSPRRRTKERDGIALSRHEVRTPIQQKADSLNNNAGCSKSESMGIVCGIS